MAGRGGQAADRKTQILTAAAGLLSAQGVQALSFEAVAQAAGLSRQLVRYYFADLDALMAGLCDHLAAGYRELLIGGILELREVERLGFFLDFFFDLAEARRMPGDLEAYDALVAWSVGAAPLRERMCAQYRTLGQVMVHELAIAHPQLPMAKPITFENFVIVLISALRYACNWQFNVTCLCDYTRCMRSVIILSIT